MDIGLPNSTLSTYTTVYTHSVIHLPFINESCVIEHCFKHKLSTVELVVLFLVARVATLDIYYYRCYSTKAIFTLHFDYIYFTDMLAVLTQILLN